MKQNKNPSWAVALCGMAVAFSVVLMLLGAILPVAMFIAPALGGILIAVVQAECGARPAWTAYAAASVLGVLLVPPVPPQPARAPIRRAADRADARIRFMFMTPLRFEMVGENCLSVINTCSLNKHIIAEPARECKGEPGKISAL